MKKTCLLFSAIVLMLCMSSCSFNKIEVPASSSDYMNDSYQNVVNDLNEAGFMDVQTKAIDDINSNSEIKDGSVESVTIGEISEFQTGQKFSADDSVKIVYHNIPKILPPIGTDEIQDKSYKEIVEAFEESGFTNITTEEVYDLDPDIETKDCVMDVFINNNDNYSVTEEVPFDSEIIVRAHYPFKKYTLSLRIDFNENIVFDKYDISMLIDGEKQEELTHGENAEFDIRLKDGKHTLAFRKIDDSSIETETEVDLTSDLEVKYDISCHSDYISLETEYIDYDIALDEGQIKMMNGEESYYGKQFEEVKSEFTEKGFTNIVLNPVYDIVFGITPSGSVKTVTIDGRDDYRRGVIFQNDAEVVITYSMKTEEDPEYIEEQKRKEAERKKKEEELATQKKKEEEEQKKKEEEEFEALRAEAEKDKANFEKVSFGRYNGQSLIWYVLVKEEDKSLLITERIVAEMPFREATIAENATWALSDVRTWLNNDFYSAAFLDGEKEAILTTEITSNEMSTSDKVFLLTSSQAKELFPSDKARRASYYGEWWLLDNCIADMDKHTVSKEGNADDYLRGNETGGVRPSIWVSNDYIY